jgi:hypothetical protein
MTITAPGAVPLVARVSSSYKGRGAPSRLSNGDDKLEAGVARAESDRGATQQLIAL